MGAARFLSARWPPPGALAILCTGASYSIITGRGVVRNDGPEWGQTRNKTSGSSTDWASRQTHVLRTQLKGDTKNRYENVSDVNGEGDTSTDPTEETSAFAKFTDKLGITKASYISINWTDVGDKVRNFIVPSWAQMLPAYMQKLQGELSMAPGSLADEIWTEAHDPNCNPEIIRDARVRVGNSLCREEQSFLLQRRKRVVKALARYLDIKEKDIHPDDVPTIAMCGSGGGLRALVAGTGSYLAAQEAGLWDCVTYTAGVSGSCWLQTLYNSTLACQDFYKLVDHLRNRLGVHIAFPPDAMNLLTTAPTNKFLLAGLVEKLKGDPASELGLVDIYGMLLATRLLVPRGELGLSFKDLKLSNQKEYIARGQNPLPIYAAVRHEIPFVEEGATQKSKWEPKQTSALGEKAKQESWFQWFEFTPFEFFCEEFNAGIPIWALGRQFEGGRNVILPGQYGVPELRVPSLMGIWGSAFCATLSHYYKEIRPAVRGLAGFGGIDSLIENRNEDLIRVHPIEPATVPNYVFGMKEKLPKSCPESVFKTDHIQLMDAGMSNNLPIYPLLRPGREVDIVVAFDASADIQQENWLSVVDGYAKQRGIKGWPIGAGWPKESARPAQAARELDEAESSSLVESEAKLSEAERQAEHASPPRPSDKQSNVTSTDLSYCNVWVGTMQERTTSDEPPPSKRLFHPSSKEDVENSEFHLMQPNAGIAVVYFPLLPNSTATWFRSSSPSTPEGHAANETEPTKLAGPLKPHPAHISPDVDDFMSTWNFVYTPEQVDAVVGLAQSNFGEGEDQVKRVVRAVYERKKQSRLRREKEEAHRLRKEEQKAFVSV